MKDSKIEKIENRKIVCQAIESSLLALMHHFMSSFCHGPFVIYHTEFQIYTGIVSAHIKINKQCALSMVYIIPSHCMQHVQR